MSNKRSGGRCTRTYVRMIKGKKEEFPNHFYRFTTTVALYCTYIIVEVSFLRFANVLGIVVSRSSVRSFFNRVSTWKKKGYLYHNRGLPLVISSENSSTVVKAS
jgi:hypothetical protein